MHGQLAELLAELEARLQRLLVGGHRLHHLEQRHHLGRIEEVQPDEPPRTLRGGRLVDHGQRRGVGREHRPVLDDPVELAPHVELQLEVLGDRLHHEVAVGEVAVIERARDALASGVRVGLLQPALLDAAGQLLLDPPDALVEPLLVDLAQHDVPAGLSRDLRDPVAHEPSAEDAHLRDLH